MAFPLSAQLAGSLSFRAPLHVPPACPGSGRSGRVNHVRLVWLHRRSADSTDTRLVHTTPTTDTATAASSGRFSGLNNNPHVTAAKSMTQRDAGIPRSPGESTPSSKRETCQRGSKAHQNSVVSGVI